MAIIIFLIILVLIIFPEIFAVIALLFMVVLEFILRLFGKSFDDEPKKKSK
jgi:sensor domain CHASE-containing protein